MNVQIKFWHLRCDALIKLIEWSLIVINMFLYLEKKKYFDKNFFPLFILKIIFVYLKTWFKRLVMFNVVHHKGNAFAQWHRHQLKVKVTSSPASLVIHLHFNTALNRNCLDWLLSVKVSIQFNWIVHFILCKYSLKLTSK